MFRDCFPSALLPGTHGFVSGRPSQQCEVDQRLAEAETT